MAWKRSRVRIPSGPPKRFKHLRPPPLRFPRHRSPTGVQNLVLLAASGRVLNSSWPLTSWLFSDFAFPSKSLSGFPSALFSWGNPTFPTNHFQPVGYAGTTRVGSVNFPAIKPDKHPRETRQNGSVKRRATDMPCGQGCSRRLPEGWLQSRIADPTDSLLSAIMPSDRPGVSVLPHDKQDQSLRIVRRQYGLRNVRLAYLPTIRSTDRLVPYGLGMDTIELDGRNDWVVRVLLDGSRNWRPSVDLPDLIVGESGGQ